MAADTPPPGYYSRPRRSIIWPVLLILLGVTLLLQSSGMLKWPFWSTVWHFWPVLLILLGVELVFGASRRAPVFLLLAGAVAIAVLAAAGTVTAQHIEPASVGASTGDTISQTTSQAVLDARQADVEIQFGAGQLSLASLPSTTTTTDLAQATYTGPRQLEPQSTYHVRDGIGQLNYSYRSRGRGPLPFLGGSSNATLGLQLSPNVPLILGVQEGASTSNLDLSNLRVTNLTVESGASTTSITMPQAAGLTTAEIKGGAATINITVPPDVAAQIRYEGGLSSLQVDQSRFPDAGNNTYRSPTYDSAPNKLDLTIQSGVATVNIS